MATLPKAEGHSAYSYTETNGGGHTAPRQQSSSKHVGSLILRLVTLGATIAAFIVIIRDNQHALIPIGVSPETGELIYSTRAAKWHYSSSLIWFMLSTAIVAVHSFVCILATVCLDCLKYRPTFLLWTIFFLDLIMVNVLTAGLSSALTTAILGKYGNSHTGWPKICNVFDRFCNHIIGAMIAAGVGILALLQLCILDTYHLFTQRRRV